ncbi:ABC transporter permease [Cucumibacter marinus]|uniref:ABC transporter permease n=1 Tax=Cucumibacter marinus TaxID=1121252 RepID=UPI00048FCC2C|nr:ABC transporter permease [Cucumibacter marinus]
MSATEISSVRVPRGGLGHEMRAVMTVWLRELIRFRRDPARMIASLAQPFLFLFVLGAGLGSLIETGSETASFTTFLFPGVLAMSVLFTAAFAGISMVWDREFGFLREMLVAPVSTTAILTGKCLGGATVATVQSMAILIFAGFAGVPYDPLMIVEIMGLLFLMSFMITALGLVLASRVKQVQSAMPLVQLIITPLMFLSGALFPLSRLPDWLYWVTHLNPMTYAVAPLREVVFERLAITPEVQALLNPPLLWGGFAVPVWLQALIVAGCCAGLLALAVLLFARSE